jgi:hypothetical protein
LAIDPSNLTPTQLVRLLNSTLLGAVTNAAKLHRQLNQAGLRLMSADGRLAGEDALLCGVCVGA